MQRNEHFGRGRRGRRRDYEDRFAWDRDRERGKFSRGGPGQGWSESGEEWSTARGEYGGYGEHGGFGGEDYRGMTRGGYPGYGAGDAGWGGGYPGYGEQGQGHGWRSGAGGFEDQGQEDWRHRYDDDYWHWRNEQLRKFDQDYEDWRNERRQKFSEDFNKWRSSRPERAEGSRNTTQAVTKNR